MNFKSRIFATVYIFTVVYLSLSFFYGKTGLFATNELLAYKEKIDLNITELKKINNELGGRLQPLSTMEKITLKAREMGYIAPNERKIFLAGLEKPDVYHSLGNIVYAENSTEDNSQFIRAMSFIFSLLFYILSCILLPAKNDTKKNRQHNTQNYKDVGRQWYNTV